MVTQPLETISERKKLDLKLAVKRCQRVPLYVKEVLTMRQENVKNQNNRRNMFSSGKSVAAAANRPNPFARGGGGAS